MFKRTTDGEYTGCSCCCLRHLQGVSEKVAPPPKTFCNIFTSAKSFCVKLCKFAIRHAMMKNYIISEMLHCTGTLHFHFLGEYSELDRVKTMATRGKMNAIWWNLQKLVDIMWIWIANNFFKFHAKRLNGSENITKSFRASTFLKYPVYQVVHSWLKHDRCAELLARQIPSVRAVCMIWSS